MPIIKIIKIFILFIILAVTSFILSGTLYSQFKYIPQNGPTIKDTEETQQENTTTEPAEDEEEFQFTPQKWNKARGDIEEGKKPGDVVEVSSKAVVAELPPPPSNATVEFTEYDTKLTINGRKFIGVKFTAMEYDKPDNTRRNSSSFDMKQELQVKIKGEVGKKIKVNVDFDDTVSDRRDISVAYRGDPEEVVQEAAFGDIVLSLPNTEFVGYSRQAFGIKLDTRVNLNKEKTRKLRTLLIASQTKGTPESKRFTGFTTMEHQEIPVESYSKRKYFKVAFGTDKIKEGTIEVYRKVPVTTDQNVSWIQYSTFNYTGTDISSAQFKMLYPITDYAVDYNNGILVFNGSQDIDAIIGVYYKKDDGVGLQGSLKDNTGKIQKIVLIKDERNTASTELKNYYHLNRTQIVPDNYNSNFVLEIHNGNKVPTVEEWSQKTSTTTIPRYRENIIMNFDKGYFYVVDKNNENTSWNFFSKQIYETESPVQSGYKFFLEYRLRKKTFDTRMGVIPQSEQVILDGKKLERDKDYTIDYDIGTVEILNQNRITDSSVIDMSYEYSTFGLAVGETFLGLRSELSLTNNIFIGISVLQNNPPSPQSVPDLRSVIGDKKVYEIDSRITGINFGPLSIGFGGEKAISERNTNKFGSALIDSMEGIKDTAGPSITRDSWKYGHTSTPYPPDSIDWQNSDEYIRNIYGLSESDVKEERQSVLDVTYNLADTTSCAIVQNLSYSGLDFSKKDYFEIRLSGSMNAGYLPNENDEVIIEFGQFNEDVDHDDTLDTEDNIIVNNSLNEGEDIGWLFNPSVFPGKEKRVGPANGLIDTEDLNNDRNLQASDEVIEGRQFVIKMSSFVNQSTWLFHTDGLGKQNITNWQYVKQVRVTVKAPGKKGTVRIGKINVVGIDKKWGSLTPGLTVSAVNNYEDATYRAISPANMATYPDNLKYYESLYGGYTQGVYKQEQALQMYYDFKSTSSVVARLTRPMDLTSGKTINFAVYGDKKYEMLSFRAGSTENNYFEYKRVVDWTGWKLISIEQEDLTNDKIPDRWKTIDNESSCTNDGYGIGSPNLSAIGFIEVVLSSTSNTEAFDSSTIYVNDIYMSGSWIRTGEAYKLYSDITVNKWGSFGGKYKYIDPNFETFTSQISNQMIFEQSGYLNLSRISFLPINSNASRTETRRSALLKTNDFVSALEQDNVINESKSVGTTFTYGKLPRLGYNYSTSFSSISNRINNIYRNDIKVNQNGSFNYSIGKITSIDYVDMIFPRSVDLSGGLGTSKIEPWLSVRYSTMGVLVNPVIVETSQNYRIAAPWQMFKNRFSFNPSFGRSYVFENKEIEGFPQYNKSASQNLGLSTSFRITNWFTPSANYSINTNETYDLSSQDPEQIAKMKAVTRNVTEGISTNFGARDLVPGAWYLQKVVQSLNYSVNYNFTLGDRYENVASTYSAFDDAWIIENLREDNIKEGNLITNSRSNTTSQSWRWKLLEGVPFTGRWAPVREMNASMNHSQTNNYNYDRGTQRKQKYTTWPDVSLTFTRLEKMFGVDNFIASSQLNAKTYEKNDRSFNVEDNMDKIQVKASNKNNNYSLNLDIRKYLRSLSLSYGDSISDSYEYNLRRFTTVSKSKNFSLSPSFDLFKMTLTPRYEFRDDKSWAGDPSDPGIKPSRDLQTQTASISFHKDATFPAGITMPLIGKTLPLRNRLIFDTSLTWTNTDSESGVEVNTSRTDQYALNMSGNYEVSDNLRVTVGGGYLRFINREVAINNYQSYNVNADLTITF
ncbi:MAG: hypothetical protein A2252_01810 [Elusimicrobia bacterium RIFOXYA2_FULL_39_19]|nr:MAG: hypothetical protein A2252_01810 [Elusimicrobia bacterium RIFOXYA2_FULL_39_19]